MSNRPVKPENYVHCICGQECKGKLALSNHARKCEMEQARSRVFVEFAQQGKTLRDDVFIAAWNRKLAMEAARA